jgi:hypothetical protein
VADILNQCTRPSFYYSKITQYVVAMCFEKMYRRLNHPEYAKPRYDCLIQAKVSSLDFPKNIAKVNKSSYDKRIVNLLPTLAELMNIKIPNLEAVLLKLKDDDSVPLYTEETYKDFHQVLRALLAGFRRSLEELVQIQESELDQYLEACVQRTTFLGTLLRLVANGSIIETHLQTIAPLLDQVCDRKKKDEEDSDLASIQVSTIYTLHNKEYPFRANTERPSVWKSYRDWLRLIVSPFDAVNVLTGYIQRIHPHPLAVSIKVIAIPQPNKKMLPWKNLLETSFSNPRSPANREMFVEKIIRTINTLQEGSSNTATYFREHFGVGSKLSRGRFSGLLHCDACIASLVCVLDGTSVPNQDAYEVTRNRISASHVVLLTVLPVI